LAEKAIDPLHQFEIKAMLPIKLGATDVSFTNSALWMVIAVIAVTSFLTVSMRGRTLVPGRWQSMAELSYEFIANMIRDNAGQSGMKYFPIIFTLFMFILFGNLLGMVPYSFTFTSHIIVTFGLALCVFIAVTLLGIVLHGAHFFAFFVPKGVPWIMLPLMIPIEVLSYLTRPVSLSIRLFANMMAGHTMLKVFAGFTVMMIGGLGPVAGGALGLLPLSINIALTGFEFLVAFLQAYVFTVLTCIYLNDAIHLH